MTEDFPKGRFEVSDSIDLDSDSIYDSEMPQVIEQVKFCIEELQKTDEFKSLDQAQLADAAIKIVGITRQSIGMKDYYDYHLAHTKLLLERLDKLDKSVSQFSGYQGSGYRDPGFYG